MASIKPTFWRGGNTNDSQFLMPAEYSFFFDPADINEHGILGFSVHTRMSNARNGSSVRLWRNQEFSSDASAPEAAAAEGSIQIFLSQIWITPPLDV
jgi:hypothetical protein